MMKMEYSGPIRQSDECASHFCVFGKNLGK